MDWRLFAEDWQKTPQNIRYIFLSASGMIGLSWLLAHWGTDTIVAKPVVVSTLLGLGVALFLVGNVMIVGKQVFLYRRTKKYRKEYSTNEKLGVTFDLVWFGNTLYLFDHLKKQYFHVKPWETALALGFDSEGERDSRSITEAMESGFSIRKSNKDISDYAYMGKLDITR